MRPPIYEPKGRAREYAPLALNLWMTCSHSCAYCYCPRYLHKKPEDFHVKVPPREGVLEALHQQLDKDIKRERPEFCGGNRRVLLSFISDAYQPHENGFTRQVLELLVEYNVPFQVLTKGGMRAVRDFDLHAGDAGYFGTTLTGAEDGDGWEPNAALFSNRLQAIMEATSAGIRTWISFEPVIIPKSVLHLIHNLPRWVDEFRVGKLNYHPHAKTIDWADFAERALDALQESGCDWRIKDSLYKYLPEGSPQSSGERPKERLG